MGDCRGGHLNAVADWPPRRPAATSKFGVVGYCWGGGISFRYATEHPKLGGAVVYYGVSPDTPALARVRAPVLGLYGGDDARVNATIPAAQEEMKRLGERYEGEIYDGGGCARVRACAPSLGWKPRAGGARRKDNLFAREGAAPAPRSFPYSPRASFS